MKLWHLLLCTVPCNCSCLGEVDPPHAAVETDWRPVRGAMRRKICRCPRGLSSGTFRAGGSVPYLCGSAWQPLARMASEPLARRQRHRGAIRWTRCPRKPPLLPRLTGVRLLLWRQRSHGEVSLRRWDALPALCVSTLLPRGQLGSHPSTVNHRPSVRFGFLFLFSSCEEHIHWCPGEGQYLGCVDRLL